MKITAWWVNPTLDTMSVSLSCLGFHVAGVRLAICDCYGAGKVSVLIL